MSQGVGETIALEGPEIAAPPDEALPNEAAPGLFYGWIMLPLSMVALVASSPGQTFGVSIFNESIRESLALSHGQLAAAYMLGTLLAAVPITFTGALMDRFGLRRTMLAAIGLFGAACLLISQAAGWWSLLLAFFCLRALGPGALAFLSSNTLAFWFQRRLGLVEGLRQLGMAAAMTVIPTFNLYLVHSFGWRSAYLLLGFSLWLLLLPPMLLWFRNRPEELGQCIDGTPRRWPRTDHSTGAGSIDFDPNWGLSLSQTLQQRSFWIVTGGTTLFGIVHTAVFFCLVPIFLDRGLSEADAAAMMTVFAISLALMNFVGGMLADRLPAPLLLAIGIAGLGASMFLLLAMHQAPTAYLVGGVMGLSQGLFFGTSQPLWARYFGRLHLGKIRGLLTTVNVGTSSLGPLFAGLLRDHFGSFDLALLAFAIAPLPLALAALTARPPAQSSTGSSTH